jgi:hypothetical protein
MSDELTKNRGLLKLYESFSTEEEYRASKCLSYSIIKDVHDNPEVLTEEREPSDKEWFRFGSLTDLLLTSPIQGFDKKVFVNDRVPSEQYKNMADYIVDHNYSIPDLTDAQVDEIYEQSGSKVNWGPTVKRQRMFDNCAAYLEVLTKHKGKLIVDSKTYLEANAIAEMVKHHKWTKDLFMSEEEQLANHIEILYQYKIKYIYENLQCKSMIDILVVDHDTQTIFLNDFKTGSDYPGTFARHALYKYRYGYQGALYYEGLKKFLLEHIEFHNYNVDPFRFIYVSRLKPTFPLTLEMSRKCHLEFRDEGIDNLLYHIPPLVDIMEEAGYYMNIINEGQVPTTPYELTLSDGVVTAGVSSDYDALI